MPMVETVRMIRASIPDTLVVDGIDIYPDVDAIERYIKAKEAAGTEIESLED